MIASVHIYVNFQQQSEGLESVQALDKLEDTFIPELKKLISTLEEKGVKVTVTGTQSATY